MSFQQFRSFLNRLGPHKGNASIARIVLELEQGFQECYIQAIDAYHEAEGEELDTALLHKALNYACQIARTHPHVLPPPQEGQETTHSDPDPH